MGNAGNQKDPPKGEAIVPNALEIALANVVIYESRVNGEKEQQHIRWLVSFRIRRGHFKVSKNGRRNSNRWLNTRTPMVTVLSQIALLA